jgi:hypothetical protein
MAGRPIKRACEEAKRNPLVGYIKDTSKTGKDIWEPLVPLMLSTAEDQFKKAYSKTALNFIVYIGSQYDDDLIPLAQDKNAVVLYVSDYRRQPNEPRYYTQGDQKRGSVTRTTPFTPFTMLHRLGDRLQARYCIEKIERSLIPIKDLWQFYNYRLSGREEMGPFAIEQAREMLKEGPPLVNLNAGVDTQAGRMNILSDWSQMVSDVFAKYLLTGKMAYDPPTSKCEHWNKYYDRMREWIPVAVMAMVDSLRPGRVYNLLGR